MKSALKKVSLILAICFVAFHLYTAAFGTMPGIVQKSIHLGFLLVIFYINAMVDSEKRWEQIFLGIMALFALGGCAYITILDENLQLRAGIVYASDIAIEASTGSAENARLLAMDETDFGTMGMDMTLSCYNAEGEFEGLPAEQIMHVATHSGTGATVHVITSAKSDINSIPDLAGTKFGVTAGMMAGYLDDVLWAYDMTTDDLGSVVNLSLSDLCTALQDGNIDAFLYATPAPGTNFTDLAMSFGIKVVDIGQEAVDKLMAEKPWYHTVVIPAGTYDGCDEDITTFAQYTALCARADVPEETVYNLVKTMMENADALEAVHKNAAGTCPERGIEGALIPMHPGAERYYKEVGVLD